MTTQQSVVVVNNNTRFGRTVVPPTATTPATPSMKRSRLVMEKSHSSSLEVITPVTKRPHHHLVSDTTSPPPHHHTRKNAKRCLTFDQSGSSNMKQQVTCTLSVTKDYSCMVSFKLLCNNKNAPLPVEMNHHLKDMKVADFASKGCLLAYKRNDRFEDNVIRFEVNGEGENSRMMLCYMKGLLNRKDEIAVVPIPNTNKQLLIYEESSSTFSCSLNAVFVNRFNLVLDLDETLIRTRVPKSEDEKPIVPSATSTSSVLGEHEFYVDGIRYICCVRPGTHLLLGWGAQIFNVVIVTNSVLPYAREVVQILDPKREHLLKNIDVNNTEQLNRMLKTRVDLSPHPNIPAPLGMKDLSTFRLDPFESVILDDDETIWRLKGPILPFKKIVENKDAKSFFCAVRMETWKKLYGMINVRYRIRDEKTTSDVSSEPEQNDERSAKKRKVEITFSQELSMPFPLEN